MKIPVNTKIFVRVVGHIPKQPFSLEVAAHVTVSESIERSELEKVIIREMATNHMSGARSGLPFPPCYVKIKEFEILSED